MYNNFNWTFFYLIELIQDLVLNCFQRISPDIISECLVLFNS